VEVPPQTKISRQSEDTAPVEDGEPRRKLSDRLIPLWSAFITVLFALIGLIGGIIRWLLGFFRKKEKAAAAAPPPPAPPAPKPATPPPEPPPAPAPEARTAEPQAAPEDELFSQEPLARKPVREIEPGPVEKGAAEKERFDDIIETGQASEEDLDLISAPIQPAKEQASPEEKKPESLIKDVLEENEHKPRKRRGIRLRDTSSDSDDGLN
jgi:pyruvate/2-oxoglutarate dehydrogenase complex dihydrolipoamide acyltransferase (E2) component